MPKFSHIRNKHVCLLNDNSNDYLPQLPPNATSFKRFVRWLQRLIVVNENYPKTREYFRSRAAIFKEKKRHVTDAQYKYIIHPFSKVTQFREVFMMCIWITFFFFEPLISVFWLDKLHAEEIAVKKTANMRQWVAIIQGILCGVMLTDMCFNFCTGYASEQTNEVILERKLIIKRYLKTFFFFDFVTLVPLFGLHYINAELNIKILIYQFYMLRFVRLITVLQYLTSLLQFFKFQEATIVWAGVVLNTLLLIHWWTCILLLVPAWKKEIHHPTNRSWSFNAGFFLTHDIDTLTIDHYLLSLVVSISHFNGAGKSWFPSRDHTENLICSLILMTGFIYQLYIVCKILQLFGTTNISEASYDEFIHQVQEYIVTKKIPEVLKNRIILYYEYKYQKRLFFEEKIYNTLSDHLRCEVTFYTCRNLLDRLYIFQGLSKPATGIIMGLFKLELYLPNDVILTPGDPRDCIFFITFGTVMVITENGREIKHYEDGQQFGELHMLLRQMGEHAITKVVALETTEVYFIEKADIKYCLSKYPEIVAKLEVIAGERLKFYREYIENVSNDYRIMDTITELSQGRILEQRRRR